MHYFKRYYNLQCTLPQRVPRGLHQRLVWYALMHIIFASACTTGIASNLLARIDKCYQLCLSVYHGDCIGKNEQTRNTIIV